MTRNIYKNFYINIDSSYRNREQYPNPADFVVSINDIDIPESGVSAVSPSSLSSVVYPPNQSSQVYGYPLNFVLSTKVNSTSSGMSYLIIDFPNQLEYINYSNVVEIDSIQNVVTGSTGKVVTQISLPRTNGSFDNKYFEIINDDEFCVRRLDLDALNTGVGCAYELVEYRTQSAKILNTNYKIQPHVTEYQFLSVQQGALFFSNYFISTKNSYINNQIQIYLSCFSSSIDNYYNNKTISIDGEERIIIAYDGLRRLATLNNMLSTVPDTEISYFLSQTDKWELELEDEITPFSFSIDDTAEFMSPNNRQNSFNTDLVIGTLQTRRHLYRIRNEPPIRTGRINSTQTSTNQIQLPIAESVEPGMWLWINNEKQRISQSSIVTGCLHSLDSTWDTISLVALDFIDYVVGGAYLWASDYLAYSDSLGMVVSPTYSQSTVDGITWNIFSAYQFNGVVWSPDLGIFVLTGDIDYGGGNTRFLTYDGTTATLRAAPPVTFGGSWSGAAWGDTNGFMNFFVVVGGDDQYLTSFDGIIWQSNALGVNFIIGNDYNWVAFSGPMQIFVAVSSSDNRIQYLYHNSLGYHRNYSIVSPPTVSFNIMYVPFLNLFIAIGASDGIYTSVRAEYWEKQESPVSGGGAWRYITFTDNLDNNVIIVSDGLSSYIYSFDGLQWETLNITGTPPVLSEAMIWMSGLNNSVNKIVTQQNTVNTSFLGSFSIDISRPYLDPGNTLGVYLWIDSGEADDYYTGMTLDVYTTWGFQLNILDDRKPLYAGNVGGTITSSELVTVTYNLHSCMNFRPVNNYTNTLLYTPNVSTSHTWSGIVWSSEFNVFVAVSGDGDTYRITYSADGTNWLFVATFTYSWSSIAYSPVNRRFVALSNGGEGFAIYSNNATSWPAITVPTNQWENVVWADILGLFVAVASTGTDRVIISSNAINWTSITSANELCTWKQITWSGSRLVAVGDSGAGNRVMYSDDAINWLSVAASDNTKAWLSVAYGNSRFVAVNNDDTIPMFSLDNGLTWVDSVNYVSVPGGLTPTFVYWAECRRVFLIFLSFTNIFPGTYGYKITGEDGNYWEVDSAFADQGATSVAWSPELFLLASVKNYPNFFVSKSFICLSYNPPDLLFITIDGGVPVSFVNTTPSIELYQPNYYIYKDNTNYNTYRLITSVDQSTNTITVSPNLQVPLEFKDTYDILAKGDELYTALDIFRLQKQSCYEIELVSLILPNKILQTGNGNRIAFYPYVYVEFNCLNNPTSNILWSNNPNSSRCLFKIPVYNVQTPETTKFVRLDGRNMKQTITSYFDAFSLKVLLPNGDIFKVENDTPVPLIPDPDLQISYTFVLREIQK